MDKLRTKFEIPATPGNYWVLMKRLVKTEGSIRTYAYSDCGYAKWNGENWSREDFDVWFGSALEKQGQDEKEPTQRKAVNPPRIDRKGFE